VDGNEIEVVPAVPGNARDIHAITWSAWNTYANGNPVTTQDIREYFTDSRGITIPSIAQRIAKPAYGERNFCGLRNGIIVGFMRIVVRPGSNWLESLYVYAQHQGNGVGKKLMRRAMLECDGAQRTTLLAVNYAAPAIALFNSFGFMETDFPCTPLEFPNGKSMPRRQMERRRCWL
jgi:GNAT superfamily N-acetyltransferase